MPPFIIHSVSATKVSFEHGELIKETHPKAERWALEGYEHAAAYKHLDQHKRPRQ